MKAETIFLALTLVARVIIMGTEPNGTHVVSRNLYTFDSDSTSRAFKSIRAPVMRH